MSGSRSSSVASGAMPSYMRPTRASSTRTAATLRERSNSRQSPRPEREHTLTESAYTPLPTVPEGSLEEDNDVESYFPPLEGLEPLQYPALTTQPAERLPGEDPDEGELQSIAQLIPESDPNSYWSLRDKYESEIDERWIYCVVPMELQHRLIFSAWHLAQDVLWHYAYKNWPKTQEMHWPESPREVEFGRTVIENVFFQGEDRTSDMFPMHACGEETYLVTGRILNVTDLRNAACHPNSYSTRTVKCNLERAKDLALVLKDCVRTDAIVKLLGELRDEARKQFEYFEANASNHEGPAGVNWPLPQRRTLRRAWELYEWRESYLDKYPEVLKYIVMRDFGGIDIYDPINIKLPRSPDDDRICDKECEW